MIIKKPRTVKTESIIGNKFSREELDKYAKYKLWTPESHEMIVSSAAGKTFSQFERELKVLSPRLFIHFNTNIPTQEMPFGHPIRFMDPNEPNGYEFTGVSVGKGGNKFIPAMTTYNHFLSVDSKNYETRYDSVGWEAALFKVTTWILDRKKGK